MILFQKQYHYKKDSCIEKSFLATPWNFNKKLTKIYLLNRFCLFFILIFYIKVAKNSEIKMIIQGEGEINILNNAFYYDPSDVLVNGESKSECKKTCEFVDDLNNVTIKFDSKITSCENMFDGMTNIIEIDLSNFDASNVINMNGMFKYCINLKKITFGDINTSLVENMNELFYNCINLTIIDRLDFDTISVKTMIRMFRNCESLLSINAEFNPQNVEDFLDCFGCCYKLEAISLPNFRKTKATNIQGMFYQDYELKYVDLSNFEVSPSIITIEGMFEFSSSLFLIKLNLLKINNNTDIRYFLRSVSSNAKICIKDTNTINILNEYRDKIDCSDICFNENIKIHLNENTCINSCNEIEDKYELNNICYNKCPDNTYPIDGEYLCLNKKPEGYYLSNNEKYKKCYDTCKSCEEEGNEDFNNCIECKINYIHNNGTIYNFLYELNINGFKNCYIKCPNYFYYDKSSGIYYCTENKTCYGTYDKLIFELDECVNKCGDNSDYKYEYRKRCYEQCPEGSIIEINNNIS